MKPRIAVFLQPQHAEYDQIRQAAIEAEGPGIGVKLILFFILSLINIFPGSEIVGVPASEISETIFFDFNISITLLKIFFH